MGRALRQRRWPGREAGALAEAAARAAAVAALTAVLTRRAATSQRRCACRLSASRAAVTTDEKASVLH